MLTENVGGRAGGIGLQALRIDRADDANIRATDSRFVCLRVVVFGLFLPGVRHEADDRTNTDRHGKRFGLCFLLFEGLTSAEDTAGRG